MSWIWNHPGRTILCSEYAPLDKKRAHTKGIVILWAYLGVYCIVYGI